MAKVGGDTLTYSDIANKAEYSASSTGTALDTSKIADAKDSGLTPVMGTKATGDADSTTESAIAAGTIEVRSGNADLANLSRDTANSLNALSQIFDKKTVAEQQELAKVFGEEAFKAIGDLDLKEGSPEKAAVDAVVGGIMAKLGGGDALSGAAGGGLNQLVMNELAKIGDPAAMQWASLVIGAAAAKIVGGDAQTGASVAASETKNNFLSHWQKIERQKAIDEGDWEKVAYWDAIDRAQNQACAEMNINYHAINWEDPVNANLLQTVSERAQVLAASPDFQKMFIEKLATVDTSTLIAAGVLGTAVVVGTVTLYKYNGTWVKAAGPGTGTAVVTLKSPELLNELSRSGVKYTAENVVAITRTANGQLVWLETGSTGSRGAGLAHILEKHASDFMAKGIESNQIPEFITTTLSKGRIVSYQGQGTGRPIYEVIYNGVKQQVAITLGNNGFIVGANPTTLP